MTAQLDIVLKCDSSGTLESVASAISDRASRQQTVILKIIATGIGPIIKTDIVNAATGSSLIIGFNVTAMEGMEALCKERNVEARLYKVIYRLLDDLDAIIASFDVPEEKEAILGTARIVAIFKSSRKGCIIGCDITDGRFRVNDSFRVISAMGPVYTGRITSMKIERDFVDTAVKVQKAGIKIPDFKGVHIGDLVEAFAAAKRKKHHPWRPVGRIMILDA